MNGNRNMNRANLFNPFDSRSRQNEDRLTWAFIVALKYDPALQKFLRELVESQLPSEHRDYSNSWDPARVSTQTKWIESTTNLLVSVLLTDVRIQEEIRVEWSDREPRVRWSHRVSKRANLDRRKQALAWQCMGRTVVSESSFILGGY